MENSTLFIIIFFLFIILSVMLINLQVQGVFIELIKKIRKIFKQHE